jgi:hypothetical protein
MFNDIFQVESTGNRIDLLTHEGRSNITQGTINWWQSQGWEVVLWDNTGYCPAVGRNNIIHAYQQSDRTMLIMADDDITLYTHRYQTMLWLKEPFKGQGVYTLNSNHKMGTLKYNSQGWDDGNSHWSKTDQISQLYVITDKNIPCQDESLPALEDLEWAWQCQRQGIITEILHTVFLREQSQDRGSLIAVDRKQRLELYAECQNLIAKKWQVDNVKEIKRQLKLG